MPASKVYFTDFRCRNGVSQLDKLRKLLEKSEFSQIDFDGKALGQTYDNFPNTNGD